MSENTPNTLSYSVQSDGVAIITYDVSGESVNTLQANFAEQFTKIIETYEADSTALAAILVSGKPDSWIAGANIDMLKESKTAADAENLSKMAQQGFKRLHDLKKPVVAAINGAALGGGFELALACHGRILSDDPKTVLALPEVQLGLLPGGNGLQRLTQIVGLQAALDLGLTGKNIRASKAKKLGIADDVVPKSILVQTASEYALALAKLGKNKPGKKSSFGMSVSKELTELALEKNPLGRMLLFKQAREILRKKTGGHYPATEKIIDILELFASKGFDESADLEAKTFGQLVVSDTARQLIGIFHATTALKKDNGVDDPSIKPRPVKKVGVLGGGLMGGGIAFVTVQNAKIPVRLKDRDIEGVTRGLHSFSDLYTERLKKRQITKLELIPQMAMLSGTTDYSGFGDADVVIEAVFEDLSLKKHVLADVESKCQPGTIFASNTSSIPITQIAEGCARPDLVVGMHYFSPVHKMPLLEIIRTSVTAPWVVATCVALGKKQGKTVIVVNDGVGFYTSRILSPLMNEASFLLTEGVRIEDIDGAMKAWGWPVGPINLLDEVGIDIAAHVGPIMVQAFGERMSPPAIMAKLVSDGRKGRKNEKGFYLYGKAAKKAGKGKHVDNSIYELLGIEPKTKMPIEEIQMRCSLQFVNEAVRCMGDGILRTARDGDIGAIFGLGFPPFRGGPFRYVDSVGAEEALHRIESYHQKLGARWEPAPLLIDMAKTNKRFYP